MKSVLTLIIIALFALNTNAQRPQKEYYFGFNLMPTMGKDLITFGIVEVINGKVVGSTPISREKFVRYASGEMMCNANPELENLFIENQIDSCWVLYDAEYYKYGKKKYVGFECNMLNDLWRIRYSKHPYEYNMGEGWSMDHYAPNGKQWAFLKRFYNVSNQAEWFYGENMWQLFRDMTLEEWKDFYKDGDLTWTPVKLKDLDNDEEDSEDEDNDLDKESSDSTAVETDTTGTIDESDDE